MEIQTYDKFSALPESAQRLAEHYREVNPFVCDIWLRSFEQHLIGKDEEALYVVALNEDKCDLLLPLLACRTPTMRALKIRSMVNFYTTVFSPLFGNGAAREQTASSLADFFLKEFSDAVIFEFEPLRDDSMPALIADHYGKKGKSIWRKYHKHINRFETVLGDDYDDYLKRRPSQLKNTIRRKNKLLSKETNSELRIYDTGKEVIQHYPAFRLVYEESWKEEESYPDFINEALQELADAGKAKLAILFVNGEPAAAQIWFKIGDGWGVFKLAYRPKYKRYSVGTLLTAGVIEDLLADRQTTEIDFFSGDDSYKQDWVGSQRDHIGIELINNRTVIGKALSIKRRLSR